MGDREFVFFYLGIDGSGCCEGEAKGSLISFLALVDSYLKGPKGTDLKC